MPFRLHQECREPGCFKRTNARSGYCEAHETKNSASAARKEYDKRRKEDPVARLYAMAAWQRFRQFFFNRNPICQRIGADGKQCREVATLIHHLLSPRKRPDLFLDPKNVVALCAHCHPPDEGTPDWVAGRDYVPSVIEPPTVA